MAYCNSHSWDSGGMFTPTGIARRTFHCCQSLSTIHIAPDWSGRNASGNSSGRCNHAHVKLLQGFSGRVSYIPQPSAVLLGHPDPGSRFKLLSVSHPSQQAVHPPQVRGLFVIMIHFKHQSLPTQSGPFYVNSSQATHREIDNPRTYPVALSSGFCRSRYEAYPQ